jgi:hypothetical protein
VDCAVSPQRCKLRPNLGRVCVATDIAVQMRRAVGSTFSLDRSKSDRWASAVRLRQAVGDALRMRFTPPLIRYLIHQRPGPWYVREMKME